MTSAPAPVSYIGPSEREPADFGEFAVRRRLTAFWAVENAIRQTPQRWQCFRSTLRRYFWRISTGRLEPRRATTLGERSRRICEPKPGPPRWYKHWTLSAVRWLSGSPSRVSPAAVASKVAGPLQLPGRRHPVPKSKSESHHLPNAASYWQIRHHLTRGRSASTLSCLRRHTWILGTKVQPSWDFVRQLASRNPTPPSLATLSVLSLELVLSPPWEHTFFLTPSTSSVRLLTAYETCFPT